MKRWIGYLLALAVVAAVSLTHSFWHDGSSFAFGLGIAVAWIIGHSVGRGEERRRRNASMEASVNRHAATCPIRVGPRPPDRSYVLICDCDAGMVGVLRDRSIG